MQQRDNILADEADCKQKLTLHMKTSLLPSNSNMSSVAFKSRKAWSDIHMIFITVYRIGTRTVIFQHNLF